MINDASELHSYIWECDWLSTSQDFKKSMILTMARANRPVYLTVGNFAPLTLPTFVAVRTMIEYKIQS
ncbi:hypothetical protein NQ318_015146 [Aromia moschata]|uniref:Uncharacterized protein n=1 Tax=Aromia moschata TaxID=1265417 RepID=A0AAV8X6V5_9CUCU|nr:hypothetical protein NQ318_015146 [Aromia moschata]